MYSLEEDTSGIVIKFSFDHRPFSFVLYCRVGKQVVNVPSFAVRVESQKHIDLALTSPLAGGKPGRTKRKRMREAASKAGAGGAAEDDS